MNSINDLEDKTLLPCLLCVKERGFSITRRGRYYTAESGEVKFSGASPAALLGLISMWETRGEDWAYLEENEQDMVDRQEVCSGLY